MRLLYYTQEEAEQAQHQIVLNSLIIWQLRGYHIFGSSIKPKRPVVWVDDLEADLVGTWDIPTAYGPYWSITDPTSYLLYNVKDLDEPTKQYLLSLLFTNVVINNIDYIHPPVFVPED